MRVAKPSFPVEVARSVEAAVMIETQFSDDNRRGYIDVIYLRPNTLYVMTRVINLLAQ